MLENSAASDFPFGLLELDSAGKVVRYSPAFEESDVAAPSRQEVIGHNFFEEIAPVEEVQDLKGRFLAFMAFGDSVVRFNVRFTYKNFVVEGRILLARHRDHADVGGARLALVRLMPDSTHRSVPPEHVRYERVPTQKSPLL